MQARSQAEAAFAGEVALDEVNHSWSQTLQKGGIGRGVFAQNCPKLTLELSLRARKLKKWIPDPGPRKSPKKVRKVKEIVDFQTFSWLFELFFGLFRGPGSGGPKLLSGDFFETFRVFGVLDSVGGGGDLKPWWVVRLKFSTPEGDLEKCFNLWALGFVHSPRMQNTKYLNVARNYLPRICIILREMEVQRRRGTTSPDPEKKKKKQSL